MITVVYNLNEMDRQCCHQKLQKHIAYEQYLNKCTNFIQIHTTQVEIMSTHSLEKEMQNKMFGVLQAKEVLKNNSSLIVLTKLFKCKFIYICIIKCIFRLPVTVWEESSSPVLCLIKVKNGLFSGRGNVFCNILLKL